MFFSNAPQQWLAALSFVYLFLILAAAQRHICVCVCKRVHLGTQRHPSHLLNLMHALWTHLHPDTLKPKIEGGFSCTAPLPTRWPRPPFLPLLAQVLHALLQFFFFNDCLSIQRESHFQFKQSQLEGNSSCCPTDLKMSFLKHSGLDISFTDVPFLPLSYLSRKRRFISVKIPDLTPSPESLADIWTVQLCKQPRLGHLKRKRCRAATHAACSILPWDEPTGCRLQRYEEKTQLWKGCVCVCVCVRARC